MTDRRSLLIASLFALCMTASISGLGQDQSSAGVNDGRRQGKQQREQNGPRHQPPPFTGTTSFDIVLGRPSDSSVVLSLLSYEKDMSVAVVYGTSKTSQSLKTNAVKLQVGAPKELALAELQKATRYYYSVRDVATQAVISQGTFATQPDVRTTFSFTVTADSHLDQNTDLALYQRALSNALADAPDFHIDLGDTFMTEKYDTREEAAKQYIAQRYFFGTVTHSMPLFLVLGNHDGEEVRQLRDGKQSLGVWANGMRKTYFPNPEFSSFYSADATPDALAGPLQDYYAWTWGDAQFIVLNPYWHAPKQRSDERWGLSLGKTQYQWLKSTLESSKSKYKFVFIHQLIGGINGQGRGGIEGAGFGEWGGLNADGTNGFEIHRSGWGEPIHQMLVRNKVNMVVHGHDHLFAKQDLDGIVYQEVPQPGHRGPGNKIGALIGGYQAGTILVDSGHMKITVSPEHIQADFRAVALDSDGRAGTDNRKILFSYRIPSISLR